VGSGGGWCLPLLRRDYIDSKPSNSVHSKVLCNYLFTNVAFHSNIRFPEILSSKRHRRRSRWPRDLTLARTLGSCVRIPLKAWMFVCVYSVFVLSCVEVAAMRRADHSSKESYRVCKKDYETEEEATAQQRAVEPLINEWMKRTSSVAIK
jgi:hypothetical protein